MKIMSVSWVILLASLGSFGATPQTAETAPRTGAIKGTVIALNNEVTYTVIRPDGGGVGGGNMDRKLLLPTNVPVTVEFSAKGYKTWYYLGTTDKAGSTALRTMP